MTTPSLQEILSGLFGAWRLLRLDRNGMSYFDASVDGFWKSFFAAVLVAPGYVILITIHLSGAELTSGPGRIFVVHLIAYVVSWTAFPLVLHYVADTIGRSANYIGYIVAFNWAKVIQMCLYLPVSLLTLASGAPTPFAGFLNFMVSMVILFYQWFITRTALEVSGMGAVGIVLLDLIIGVVITATADGMVL